MLATRWSMAVALGSAVAGALCASTALLVASDAGAAGCTTDQDCKGGRVCVAGECTAPATAQACGSDKDCPGDLVCLQGTCGSQQAAPPPPPPPATAPAPPPTHGTGYPTPPPGYGPPAQPEPATEYNSTGLMVTGAILLPVGFLAAAIGGISIGAIAASEGGVDEDLTALAALPIGGGVFMVTGIIFLSIGAPKVPVEAGEPARAASDVTVEPMVGPGSLGLRGTF